MDPKVVKKTQDTLGKIIKKPPLTEKLLSKPPFRFLHDIVTSAIKTTGFMKGLYSDAELNSENVKEKEGKIAFLQKAIDMVAAATGRSVSAKPAKIVAGHEPEKTNEFLQALGAAISANVDNDECVKKVLSGGGGEPKKEQGRDKEEKPEKAKERTRSASRKKDDDKHKKEDKEKSHDRDEDRKKRHHKDRDGDEHEEKEKDRHRDRREKSRDREDRHRDKDRDREKDKERRKRPTEGGAGDMETDSTSNAAQTVAPDKKGVLATRVPSASGNKLKPDKTVKKSVDANAKQSATKETRDVGVRNPGGKKPETETKESKIPVQRGQSPKTKMSNPATPKSPEKRTPQSKAKNVPPKATGTSSEKATPQSSRSSTPQNPQKSPIRGPLDSSPKSSSKTPHQPASSPSSSQGRGQHNRKDYTSPNRPAPTLAKQSSSPSLHAPNTKLSGGKRLKPLASSPTLAVKQGTKDAPRSVGNKKSGAQKTSTSRDGNIPRPSAFKGNKPWIASPYSRYGRSKESESCSLPKNIVADDSAHAGEKDTDSSDEEKATLPKLPVAGRLVIKVPCRTNARNDVPEKGTKFRGKVTALDHAIRAEDSKEKNNAVTGWQTAAEKADEPTEMKVKFMRAKGSLSHIDLPTEATILLCSSGSLLDSEEQKEVEEKENESPEQNGEKEGSHDAPARMQRPTSAKGSRRRRQGREARDEDDDEFQHNSHEPAITENDLPPQIANARKMARPPSARPAPPRPKQDGVEAEPSMRLGTGAPTNLIVDDGKDEDEDENFLVEESAPPPPVVEPTTTQGEPEDDAEHGALVKKMLESKKEVEQQQQPTKKTEIERPAMSDAQRRKQRELIAKEIERLQTSIQSLTRSANPLGKIMDYVQEDMDSMQKELDRWRSENKQHALDLKRERNVTDRAIEPLKAQLTEVERGITDQLDLIAASKANIIRNDQRIQKMLQSIAHS
ncbi:TRAF3-interacting protein 1-like isoform X1 [Littorina saxatilis]|uniref:TRAF3-interacting protein 1 n=1 Tax=Littorina saxatilis TaxID=31220 RepID=A0AAN9AU48_9CAEN